MDSRTAHPLARQLAEFAQDARPPEPALDVMRLSLLDWASCGLAGRQEPVARLTRDMVAGEGGTPQASGFGLAEKLPARAAALVNAVTSHALDYDDTHFAHIGHPSVAVIPAVLAAAEREGCGLAETIEAALVGAEASVRFGMWLGRAHYQAGFHQTATAGTFGAAVGAARLLGLSTAQTLHAIGLASTRAAGLKAQFGTMGKPYNAGLAASGGLEAAMLAGRGLVSNPAALDGPNGFAATHAGENDLSALDGLGRNWLMESVSHKFHACCHGLHAALEALRGLETGGAEVERVEIITHPRWLSVCNIENPRTGLEAKFSYRLTAAMALSGHDTGALSSFSDAACEDRNLVRLRNKVRVIADEAIAETAARTTVSLADGRTLTAEHDLAAAIPLEERKERVTGKARSLVGPMADEIWQAIAACDLPAFTALMRRAP